MKYIDKVLKGFCIILGIISSFILFANFMIFFRLQPKMESFESLSQLESGTLDAVGLGLLLILVFFLLSLLRLVRHLRTVRKVTMVQIILLLGSVLSLLFVFSDVALLTDIAKQYRHDLDQPEWIMVYPIMVFQLAVTIVLTCLHAFGFKVEEQEKSIARDSNIFATVQYVGTICGLMGIAVSSLGFFYAQAWKLGIHTITTLIILLFPYVLMVGYWVVIKLQEKSGGWYDEKQLQDVGKSAFLTLALSCCFMLVLFITNIGALDGVVSMLWFPLYIFFVMLVFSLSNLYFKGRE